MFRYTLHTIYQFVIKRNLNIRPTPGGTETGSARRFNTSERASHAPFGGGRSTRALIVVSLFKTRALSTPPFQL